MANVLIVGASGYIGSFIAVQLGKAGVKTTALVRNISSDDAARKEKLENLKAAGVKLLEGSVDAEVDELVKILKGFDTVISAISGQNIGPLQLKLVEAAKQAGTIKRFFPSEFGGEYPTEGPYKDLFSPVLGAFLQGKYEVEKALKAAGIASTKVVTYGFFGWSIAYLGQINFPGQPAPTEVSVYGDGNTLAVFTHEDDIGRVVAKAVNDPRTADKKLVIRAITPTQNEIIETWERVTGKKVDRKQVSGAELDEQIKTSEGFGPFIAALLKAFWIDGLYAITSDKLEPNEPFVLATELYPDIKFITVEEYFKSRA